MHKGALSLPFNLSHLLHFIIKEFKVIMNYSMTLLANVAAEIRIIVRLRTSVTERTKGTLPIVQSYESVEGFTVSQMPRLAMCR